MNWEIERCRREIAEIEAELLAGNPDVAGLCLALSDWWAELHILQDEERRRNSIRRRDLKGCGTDQALTCHGFVYGFAGIALSFRMGSVEPGGENESEDHATPPDR
jgi:hypothetical protein